jgi:hypothetical protein
VVFLEKAIEGAPPGDPSDGEMAKIYGGHQSAAQEKA